jgi:mono/diheme cytochrome c family protein
MKNRARVTPLVICGVVMGACLVYADLKKGEYSPSQLGSLEQAAPILLSADSNYQVSAYPVPAPELAAGDGLQEVRVYCNTCHSPRYITMQPPLPGATWEAEVTKMNKAFGAGIPEETTQKIILYLQAHYAPENRKK